MFKGLFDKLGGKTKPVIGLEELWRIREDDIYPRLFGGEQRGIFPLTTDIFSEHFSESAVDPRWLFYGVFEYAPKQERPFWLYITSGSSNPWDVEPADYDATNLSGDGVEFLLATTEGGDWAIQCLQNMLAFDILLSAGRFEGKEPLVSGNRIPLRSPINGDETSLVRNVVVSRPSGLPSGFTLPSGRVEFLTFTGVTDAEIAFAKDDGTDELIARLEAAGHYPVTDPKRSSLL